MFIFGTRPEAIKLSPVIKLAENEDGFDKVIVSTGQHREMLDDILRLFNIEPKYDLNLMTKNQTLFDISSRALHGLQKIIEGENPDLVLVQGDTTTTFVGSLSAFYHKIPIAHVEAGLRSFNKYAPFPEEMNRVLTSKLADLHFAPTENNKINLLREGIPEEQIYVTGNTVIDALFEVLKTTSEFKSSALRKIDFDESKVILVTTHRRENWGNNLIKISTALKKIAEERPDVKIVYSLHKNPIVRTVVKSILDGLKNVFLLEPVIYSDFCLLMKKSWCILTDSGGIQEEAPSLGKPVLVLREVTERVEALEAGTVKIVGTDPDKIIENTYRLLDDENFYQDMARKVNPYGDGQASRRIIKVIKDFFYS